MILVGFIDLPISTIAAVAVGIFVFAAAGGIAYLVLRTFIRSVKMAIKFALLAGLLMVVLAGGVAAWFYSSETPKPPAKKTAETKRR